MKSVTTIVNMNWKSGLKTGQTFFFLQKKKNRRDLFSKRCLSNKYFFKIMLFTGGGEKNPSGRGKYFRRVPLSHAAHLSSTF